MKTAKSFASSWKRRELPFVICYAASFYTFLVYRSLQLSRDHFHKLRGLRPGWNPRLFNDISDAQWRNFRQNLVIQSLVFGVFSLVANLLKSRYRLKATGMSIVWLLLSFIYLSYLHGLCIIFILSIASLNYVLAKVFGRRKYFPFVLWIFNIFFLLFNRIYEGYPFSLAGKSWAYLDNYRGVLRWHICFNFVTLRMISFGYDYHWANENTRFDQKKHVQQCQICSSGKVCYQILQKTTQNDKFTFNVYLCYLLYAPLYVAGPIISFNAFASQLGYSRNVYSVKEVGWYGLRWVFSFILMELMTHFCYYNAFAISGLWKNLSPVDIFIIGYGVLNFMWLKFSLIWRYFRFWSLTCGIEAPENMTRCINNCYSLEDFWKNWHASFNKWLVRYIYIPLGGSQRKMLNVWVIFTFVAIWHDLEWKLLSWAWLTCLFFVPEMLMKSIAKASKAESLLGELVYRELCALAGAITITCLMVVNLVGFVVGPSGINLLITRFLQKEGIPVLGGIFLTFYVGVKLMFHIRDANQKRQRGQLD